LIHFYKRAKQYMLRRLDIQEGGEGVQKEAR